MRPNHAERKLLAKWRKVKHDQRTPRDLLFASRFARRQRSFAAYFHEWKFIGEHIARYSSAGSILPPLFSMSGIDRYHRLLTQPCTGRSKSHPSSLSAANRREIAEARVIFKIDSSSREDSLEFLDRFCATRGYFGHFCGIREFAVRCSRA